MTWFVNLSAEPHQTLRTGGPAATSLWLPHPWVSDDTYLLIPGQSDNPVKIHFSRDPSLPESSNSSWVNRDSDSTRPSGSGETELTDREKLHTREAPITREKVATLQAPLETSLTSSLKVTAFNALVNLIRKIIPTAVLVPTGSQKRGRQGVS